MDRTNNRWQQEVEKLKKIALSSRLTEERKWGQPCFTLQGKNIALVGKFKDYCVLLFFKGALLKDPKGILVKPGENSQAGRQIRFTSVGEIVTLEPVLKAYIKEAIEVEKSGLKVTLMKITERPIPEELQRKLNELPIFKTAFKALTPGRQRAYLLYFSAAKQSTTRESRIKKSMPHILKGKGLNDP